MSGFSPAFERLGSALAAVVLQQQEALAQYLPREDSSADLAARTYTSGKVTVRVSLARSYALRDHTWLCAWAIPQLGEDHAPLLAALAARAGSGEAARAEELLEVSHERRGRRHP